MKALIKIMSLTFLTLALAYCGKKGSSVPPSSKVATDATQIQISDMKGTITWSQATNNIYISTSSICVKGLNSQGADDQTVKDRFAVLADLLNTSVVGKGKLTTPGADSIYLTVKYSSGDLRTFNLSTDMASVNEETLSRASEIIDFFNEVNNDIQQSGIVSCNNGKK